MSVCFSLTMQSFLGGVLAVSVHRPPMHQRLKSDRMATVLLEWLLKQAEFLYPDRRIMYHAYDHFQFFLIRQSLRNPQSAKHSALKNVR